MTTAWCRRTASSSSRRCRPHRQDPRRSVIRIETQAGHGAGKPVDKMLEERADVFAFLVRELKVPVPMLFGLSM